MTALSREGEGRAQREGPVHGSASGVGRSPTWALAGRSALVTGGGGGIGRATALLLAAAGARVVVADIAADRGEETAALVAAAGGEATFVRTDVSQADQVRDLVAHTVEAHGRLDCAVNAAAIEFEDTLVSDAVEADYDRMMDVNVRSVFLCLKYETSAMLAQGDGGSIVTIASTSATRPQPRTPLYTASKHAVLGLVRACAVDYASKGIRINAVSPGAVDTPMLRQAVDRRGADLQQTAALLSPMRRLGDPGEIAKAVLWLCSDDSSFTTGHNLASDGGMLAR